MFFPYLEGYKLKPLVRGRVGGGISALLSLAGYLQILLTAGFGVVAALQRIPRQDDGDHGLFFSLSLLHLRSDS